MCGAVACAMRYGYCDILAKGSNPYSTEEALEGDVCGVPSFAVLLHGGLQGGDARGRSEIRVIWWLP